MKPVKQSFEHQQTLLEMTWRKKNLMMIAQFHRKYQTQIVGNTTKMPYIGYDYQEIRIKDWNSGTRSHSKSRLALRYLEIALIV